MIETQLKKFLSSFSFMGSYVEDKKIQTQNRMNSDAYHTEEGGNGQQRERYVPEQSTEEEKPPRSGGRSMCVWRSW